MLKRIITILHFFILITLIGCNPEEVENPTIEPTAILTRIDIIPSPLKTRGTSQLKLAKGNKQAFIATGHYSDGSSKVLSNLSLSAWRSSNEETGFFSKSGVFSTGNTTGDVTVYLIKDNVTSNTVSVEVSAAVITTLAVTPPASELAMGQMRPLTAIATYSDGTSSDVSDSVTWTSEALSTATVTPTGRLAGVDVGHTTITATKDNVTSNTVSVEVYICRNTGVSCTDVFEVGNGKLFTNSPSRIALHSIGGSVNNGFTQEIGTSGPAGNFVWFNWANANRLCATYSNESLAGRTNWRLATRNELKLELFNTYGNMFNARGWPVRLNYWSSTSRGPGFLNVSLRGGNEGASLEEELYASCVSVP